MVRGGFGPAEAMETGTAAAGLQLVRARVCTGLETVVVMGKGSDRFTGVRTGVRESEVKHQHGADVAVAPKMGDTVAGLQLSFLGQHPAAG